MAARLSISIAERHDLNHEPGVSIAHREPAINRDVSHETRTP
jgi:hypothetical protein